MICVWQCLQASYLAGFADQVFNAELSFLTVAWHNPSCNWEALKVIPCASTP
jgi:hypothetical protein